MPDLNLNKTFMYMDEKGVKKLSEQIFKEVNTRIKNRMIDTVTADDTTHTPTAAAVYKAIASKSNYTFTPYTGDLSLITDPRTDTIYLQRNSESDTVWTMYVYDTSLGWINIGGTQIDLSNYWSKSDKDLTELSNKLGLNSKVDKADVTFITKEELYTLIADIDASISYDTPYFTVAVSYDGPNGKSIAAPIIDKYADGSTYYVPSPHIHGYTPNIDVVKGVADSDINVTVTYALDK